jgi:glycosyl transferase, family 25
MARVGGELAPLVRGDADLAPPAAAPAPAGGAMRGYVISLPRRADRRQRFQRWNASKGIDLHLSDAADGRALDRRELVEAGLIADQNLAFSAGALGNALSHRALWLQCLANDQPILVFEDDAYISDGLREWIAPIRRELDRGCDILYLGYNRDVGFSLGYGEGAWCNIGFDPSAGEFAELTRRYDGAGDRDSHCILDARLVWGTLAYAIGPRGAQTLLRQCFPLAARYPVRLYGTAQVGLPYALDGIINSLMQRGRIKVRAIFPPLVVGPNDRSDSDVVGHPPAS